MGCEEQMIHIEFTEEQKKDLHYWRFHHPHPRVQRKMEVVWLKSQGVAHQEIARLVNIDMDTVTEYLRQYQEGGIERLKDLRFYRPISELESYRTTIEVYFRDHPPKTLTEASHVIEQLTGIKRSPPQVRVFMKRIGMKVLKVGQLPAKADVEKQETFKKKS